MAEPTRIRTKAEEALANHFAALDGDDPIREIRATAFDAFLSKGLPHRRIEDWKYTDLRNLMREAPGPAVPAGIDDARAALAGADVFDGVDRARLVFVNGVFMPSLSDMAGVAGDIEFASLNAFLARGGAVLDRFAGTDPGESPILALNSAFVRDGAILRVKDGAKLSRAVEIANVFAGGKPGLQTMRHQVRIGRGAEATILETFSGPDGVAYQTNAVTEVQVDADARVRWVVAQEEGAEAIHLHMLIPRIADRAVFDPFNFATGARVARAEIRLAFEGEAASAGIRGIAVARGRQHLDATLIVDHALPNCTSKELFKAAIGGEAKGVFQGKIIVRPDAQKTDGQMMSQALLLSDGAEFSNKPELEIFADDVICGHGATCGQIDEDMLFFLRSRGIDKSEAERLLIQAFLAEAIEEIGEEAVVSALEARTRHWLGAEQEVLSA
ncbi:Fe-S cluster assembly protein SufD [Propylenella binzhouense]|uniref:Fe-S cluster assembly protein SufD n=1 Tax=Propylenella binzhouense TaxID=2555902 RepID=A0A964WSQ0_9HYPH|nr:Fe-S cluster assembly protein SufD [Propylenella binzhouense]MYZ47197.1 Fe-S cluster assembly protein SufD [Propylenella binzhouense]